MSYPYHFLVQFCSIQLKPFFKTPHVHIRPIRLFILHADIIFSMDPTCCSSESLGFGSCVVSKLDNTVKNNSIVNAKLTQSEIFCKARGLLHSSPPYRLKCQPIRGKKFRGKTSLNILTRNSKSLSNSLFKKHFHQHSGQARKVQMAWSLPELKHVFLQWESSTA